jgi:heme/copper-type cytochrome/quinol oxidase subunit 2
LGDWDLAIAQSPITHSPIAPSPASKENIMTPSSLRWLVPVLVLAVFGLLVRAQESGERRFAVTSHKYAFSPARIEVQQDDLVRVTFSTSDIPHSFTIDKYRIAKRVEPGKPIVFEFRADQPGRFPIYCNLTADEGCRKMVGELVVTGRK